MLTPKFLGFPVPLVKPNMLHSWSGRFLGAHHNFLSVPTRTMTKWPSSILTAGWLSPSNLAKSCLEDKPPANHRAKKSSRASYFCSFNWLLHFMVGRALNLWTQLTRGPCCCYHGPSRLQICHSGWLPVLQSWSQGSLISCLAYDFVSDHLHVQSQTGIHPSDHFLPHITYNALTSWFQPPG